MNQPSIHILQIFPIIRALNNLKQEQKVITYNFLNSLHQIQSSRHRQLAQMEPVTLVMKSSSESRSRFMAFWKAALVLFLLLRCR